MPTTAAWAAAAAQGHVGRSRRLARDPRLARPAGGGAGDPGVADLAGRLPGRGRPARRGRRGRRRRAVGRTGRGRDRGTADRARASAATGKGTAATARGASRCAEGTRASGRSRGPPAPSATRSTGRSSTWPRSTAMCCCSTPARRSRPAHPDFADDAARSPLRITQAGTLQRLDAVLACREALDLNVKPRIAVEAMTAALRLPLGLAAWAWSARWSSSARAGCTTPTRDR